MNINYKAILRTVPGVVVGLAALLLSPSGAYAAYNHNSAANYADSYAFARNSAYPTFSADCANFASQSLAAGGYAQVRGNGDASNDNNWFMYKNWWEWWFRNSNSWTVAKDNYRFQMWHMPGGWTMDIVRASDARYWYAYDNGNMWQGDLLYYNWHNNTDGANIEHMGFQTYGGPSYYNGVVGDREDQHINDRYHARWNLTDVNSDPMNTVIFETRVDNAN